MYFVEEIAQVEDWIDSIKDINRVVMTMYDNIKEIQGIAKAQILEEDKFYSATNMEIFIDDSREEPTSIEVVVQQFKSSFEGVRDDTDIQRIFNVEDILKQLDDNLDNFGALK